jgi:hypothetical protein
MRWITAVRCFLFMALFAGLIGIPVSIVISFEPDGGTPADELHQKKRLAQTLLVASGATAITAVCGLYLAGLAHRRAPDLSHLGSAADTLDSADFEIQLVPRSISRDATPGDRHSG